MRVSYREEYFEALPERHPFPMAKYPALHRILLSESLVAADSVHPPRPVSWADLALVHTPRYLHAVSSGSLGREEERRIGLPWSPSLITRARYVVQGTINAGLSATLNGTGGNLAGGTHHAFADHGAGFCIFNDVAVAVRVLQASHWIRRAMILDLDVHQGDGTASIFAGDPSVFTVSVHGARNFPFHKEVSSIDVPLDDDTGDDEYLSAADAALDHALDVFVPDLIFYLAGVDVLAGDRFGRLALSPSGLAARESLVLSKCRSLGVPVAVVVSGGYSESAERTAHHHAEVYRQARRLYG